MLSLIIPSYNERENLKSLLPLLQDLLKDEVFEIIIVDDHSPDGTSDYVREIARSDLRIRLVERRGRKGLASACSYVGANDLLGLHLNTEFIEITSSALRESAPHDIMVV